MTPLPGLTAPSRVSTIREHFAGRSRIIFDSGGYAVQQGLLTYEGLYQRLLDYYRDNRWADVYVLPDFVPTSNLSEREVEERVQATIAVGHLFYAELPATLRTRVLPVVQGHTRRQILSCVEAYRDLGATTIGFGSFGTTGMSNDINIMTAQAIDLLAFLANLAPKYGFDIHAFGIGSPTFLPVLHELGIASFDSSCWLRTAGFGNILLPFGPRRSVTGGRLREKAGQRPLTRSELEALQMETGHTCFFCRLFEDLRGNRFYQILHNLTVIMDTIESLNTGAYLGQPLFVEHIEESPQVQLARKAQRAYA